MFRQLRSALCNLLSYADKEAGDCVISFLTPARQLSLNIIATLSLTIVSQVRADILMIDLNGSSDEIAAARKAAEARHEKLVLLPPRTDDQEAHYAEIHRLELEDDNLQSKLGDLMASGSIRHQAQIDQVHAQMKVIEDKRDDLSNR